MKKLDIALLIGFIFTVILTGFGHFTSQYVDLKDNVIRLHILANSDSSEDQKLKLKVRDRILQDTQNIFRSDMSLDEMEKSISCSLSVIEEIAENEIIKNGYDYSVKAELVNMPFNDRTYGEITLPAGYYDALRITIGNAEGHNWWCMMYPSMCIPSSVDWDEYNNVFSSEEIDMMKNPQNYRFKFKIAEIFEKFRRLFGNES